MNFTATVVLTVEVPLEAKDEDDAWTKAETDLVGEVENLVDHLTPGARVYRCVVDEVEAG